MNTGFVRPAVATVPTVYGIETHHLELHLLNLLELQQYLPFTVLKLTNESSSKSKYHGMLQQYLPFTVLKLLKIIESFFTFPSVATVPTVYGIETNRS